MLENERESLTSHSVGNSL